MTRVIGVDRDLLSIGRNEHLSEAAGGIFQGELGKPGCYRADLATSARCTGREKIDLINKNRWRKTKAESD